MTTDREAMSGPALDAEISIRVFSQPCEPGLPGQRWLLVADSGYVPEYSTDAAAAMTVFEAMVEMTGAGSIGADMEDARGEGLVCTVTFGFQGSANGYAVGPLPLAICRAALLAVRESPDAGQEG